MRAYTSNAKVVRVVVVAAAAATASLTWAHQRNAHTMSASSLTSQFFVVSLTTCCIASFIRFRCYYYYCASGAWFGLQCKRIANFHCGWLIRCEPKITQTQTQAYTSRATSLLMLKFDFGPTTGQANTRPYSFTGGFGGPLWRCLHSVV